MYNYIWVTGAIGICLLIIAIATSMKELMYCERHRRSKLKYLIPNGLLGICAIGWFVLTICLYVSLQNQL